MKQFTFLLTGIAALLLLPTLSQAQETERERLTAEERAQALTDSMTVQLELSEAQQSEVYDINLKYAEKMETLRSSAKGSGRRARMKAMKEMKQLRKDKNADMEEALSEEQFETYITKQEERRERIRRRLRERRSSKN